MPVAPFVPLISSGIGMLFGGKKSDEPQMTPQQSAANQGAMDSAGQMSSMSKYLMQQGKMGAPAYGKAIDYYSTLLGQGGRGKMQQAVAPAAGQIADTTKGAQMNLERMGIQGGQKQQAMAELNRQKAGQISNLTTGVQAGAAGQLGQLGVQGGQMFGQGLQGLSSAGNIYANLLGKQTEMANTQYDRNKDFGNGLSSLVGSGLKGAMEWWKGRGGGDGWQGVPWK